MFNGWFSYMPEMMLSRRDATHSEVYDSQVRSIVPIIVELRNPVAIVRIPKLDPSAGEPNILIYSVELFNGYSHFDGSYTRTYDDVEPLRRIEYTEHMAHFEGCDIGFTERYKFSACTHATYAIEYDPDHQMGEGESMSLLILLDRNGATMDIDIGHPNRHTVMKSVFLAPAGTTAEDARLLGAKDDLICHGKRATVIGSKWADVVDLSGLNEGQVIVTGAGQDNITGTQGHDTICSGADQDLVSGEAGDDYLDGGMHSDILLGKAGDDIFNGGGSINVIWGDTGQDTVLGPRDNICSNVEVALGCVERANSARRQVGGATALVDIGL